MFDDVCVSACDLSGDDVIKLVQWSVIYTKRDFEQTLESLHEEITFDTTGERFAGEKIGAFFERVSQGSVIAPKEWIKNTPQEVKLNSRIVPVTQTDGTTTNEEQQFIASFNSDGKKFIKVSIELVARMPVTKSSSEKDQVIAIRNVTDALRGL